MTIAAESRPARIRLLRVAAATWLSLVSAAVIVDHVVLSRLANDIQISTQNVQATLLKGRLAELERRVDATERRPAQQTQASFDTVRQTLEERLAKLEQEPPTHTAAADVEHLQSRLEQLEARLKQVRQPPAPVVAPVHRPPPAEAAKPLTVEPPFRLLGIDLRAGERFLSIAPAGTRSLADARVLRLGEVESGWQLESLEGRTAVFRFEGQARQLTVP
jgi:hypothetical protein